MALASSIPDYEAALDDLSRTIRTHRPACPPRETARLLLEYDAPGHTALVGVSHDVTRAVLYHERDRYVVGVDFGPDGLDGGGPTLADFEFGSSVYSWVRRMRAYWGWLNPRFR